MRKTGIFDNKKMPNLNGGFFSALIFIKFYRNIKNITRKFLRISPLFPFPRKKHIPQRPGPRATCRVGGCRPRDPGNKTCRECDTNTCGAVDPGLRRDDDREKSQNKRT